MFKYFLPFALFIAGTLAGCSKSEPGSAAVEATPSDKGPEAIAARETGAAANLACALLTAEEIRSVLGEELKGTQGTQATENGFLISQCHFALPNPGKSIDLRVVQRAPEGEGRDPRAVWQEQFVPGNFPAKKAIPEKVAGVGDEAYWKGNARSGALYVLKGNAYVRVSLVDSLDKETSLKNCSDLAALILQRL